MKRATTMLGVLALAAAGFLFTAPAAHAAEGYITPKFDAGNGVMCDPRVGGTLWPVNGTTTANSRFYYCGSDTAANRGSQVYTSLKGVSSLESSIKTLFTNKNVKVYVMKSPLQYAEALGFTPGDQETRDLYDAQLTTSGFSIFTADNDPENAIIIYEQVPDSSVGYPALKPNLAAFQRHDAKHEAGHHYDRHYSTSGTLSDSTHFMNIYPDDKTWEMNNNPNHSTDSVAFAYWWNSRSELFAEEFAIVMGSLERSVDVPTSNFFICTKAYVFGVARNQQIPTSYSYSHCTP